MKYVNLKSDINVSSKLAKKKGIETSDRSILEEKKVREYGGRGKKSNMHLSDVWEDVFTVIPNMLRNNSSPQ